MHIEPLIKTLQNNWFWRIIIYLIPNLILAFLIEIWKFSVIKIIIIILFMIIYIIIYENLGIMYERINNLKK